MQRRQQRRGKRHFKTKICVIMTILRSFHVVKRKRCWRSTLQLEYKGHNCANTENSRFIVVCLSIKTANMVILRCCFAEDGSELSLRACSTCSTIIFHRSTNQTVVIGVAVICVCFSL